MSEFDSTACGVLHRIHDPNCAGCRFMATTPPAAPPVTETPDDTARLDWLEALGSVEVSELRAELARDRRPVYELQGNPTFSTAGMAPSRWLCAKCMRSFTGERCEWCELRAEVSRLTADAGDAAHRAWARENVRKAYELHPEGPCERGGAAPNCNECAQCRYELTRRAAHCEAGAYLTMDEVDEMLRAARAATTEST